MHYAPNPTRNPLRAARATAIAAPGAAPLPAADAPSPWRAAALRVVRRVHLYSGLSLLPFVLVYGVSAFLFNHGGATAQVAERIEIPEDLRASLAIDAAAAAQRVADALGTTGPIGEARIEGDWTFEFEDEDGRHRLTVPVAGGHATLRRIAADSSRTTRLGSEVFAAETAAAERAARVLVAARVEGGVRLRRASAPTLRHRAESTEVATSLDRCQATERPASPFDLGRLLMRLHTAHGYRGDDVARWLWAVVVDVMAAAMVLWACTGLAMWWQKRSLRRRGLITLAAAAGAAVALGAAMQALFAR